MNLEIRYTPEFVRTYSKLERDLQLEIKSKIELFKNTNNHRSLKVHKLHGRLKNRFSFSINYKFRVIFEYIKNKTVALVTVGSHDIYK